VCFIVCPPVPISTSLTADARAEPRELTFYPLIPAIHVVNPVDNRLPFGDQPGEDE
jgi:hypothetical protein